MLDEPLAGAIEMPDQQVDGGVLFARLDSIENRSVLVGDPVRVQQVQHLHLCHAEVHLAGQR